jgi:ATP-dependent helicase/nuclease subunit B
VKRLPEQGGYSALTDAFCSLAETHLTVPLGVSTAIDEMSQWDDASDVNEALSGVFAELRALDRLDVNVTWDEWADTFAEMLARATRPLAPPSHHGVQVLDAMAARGLGFRALFLIGMNEKLFPRYIHEDGFLRDRHRLVLSETLGYKIDQKLQGYGEEALLFELLRASAGGAPVSFLSTSGCRRSPVGALRVSGCGRGGRHIRRSRSRCSPFHVGGRIVSIFRSSRRTCRRERN